jgi:uncharacterized membrane protein YhaH (DUF805 family)
MFSQKGWAADKIITRYILQLVLNWRGRISRTVFFVGLVGLRQSSHLLHSVLPHSRGAILIGLAFSWMFLALCAKRLHDIGATAWWLAPAILLAVCARHLSVRYDGVATEWHGFLLLGILGALLLMLLMLLFRKGGPSANVYGEQGPKLFELLAARKA